ncbi:protein kinase domain-containing protein [Thiomicrorhabdus heinhorstiae]|uniref:Protein kinase n=1 Tax=Thiomicrorhabdus heinhorstiae TaxID=2748010 RepID=A0ABS0BXB1_9GAMM|nr:leucine-rich repeat-containing protein kinase family protein [Thiomicrorhabdus heinhorstiae]MBF6057486.1 protein kinase [Thiomicrorhabdus heinhorstiae]
MQTLQTLNSGELKGAKRVKIAEDLTEFPTTLYELADTLEILDLSGNRFNDLPEDFAKLQKLRIVFLSDNEFEQLPSVLGQCANLEMIGFKANRIKQISSEALPPKLRWLILTDNQIEQLPDCFERLPRMQKLMLAGNRLKELPDSLEICKNLQLLRISANELTEFPQVITRIPNLAWCAFSGNPFCEAIEHSESLAHADLSAYELQELLGQGASGRIHLAQEKSSGQSKAVKLFKGGVTSDGYPQDEMRACITAGEHPNLVVVEAKIGVESPGLVMKLIPEDYVNLGLPPSFESCTRDCFEDGFSLDAHQLLKILRQATSALMHLHEQGLMHGDFYAHNVLINDQAHILLGDFGAASHFDGLDQESCAALVRMEKRALAHFIEDLWQQSEIPQEVEEPLRAWHDALLQDAISLEELLDQMENTLWD